MARSNLQALAPGRRAYNSATIRSTPTARFRVVRGSNLAPEGALIKRSAATTSLLRHTGPAYVMHNVDDVTARTGVDLDGVARRCRGIERRRSSGRTRHARVGNDSDSRSAARSRRHRYGARSPTHAMSGGTSYGTVFLHVAPVKARSAERSDWCATATSLLSMPTPA